MIPEHDRVQDEQDEQREWENQNTRSNRSVHSRQEDREPRDRISSDQRDGEADGPSYSAYRVPMIPKEPEDQEEADYHMVEQARLDKIQQEKEDARDALANPTFDGPSNRRIPAGMSTHEHDENARLQEVAKEVEFMAGIRETVLSSNRYRDDPRPKEVIWEEYLKENPILEDPNPERDEHQRGMAGQIRAEEQQRANSMEQGNTMCDMNPYYSNREPYYENPEASQTQRRSMLSLFEPHDSYVRYRRCKGGIRVPDGKPQSKVAAFGSPQVQEKWVDNRVFQHDLRYDDKAWLPKDVEFVVPRVAQHRDARERMEKKEKLPVNINQHILRDTVKGLLELVDSGRASEFGQNPRSDHEKVYNEILLQRIREELVAAGRAASK
jgi:hypothetical protein